MEVLLEAAAALSDEGNRMPLGLPPPLDLALFLREFENEISVPFLPERLVSVVTRPLAWLARLRGRDARYRGLRAGGSEVDVGLN
jgi:hypothetical protein